MDYIAKLLLDYLRNVVYDPEHAVLDVEKLPDEFQDFGKGLIFFSECVLEAAALAKAISKGNLDTPLPPADNEIAASLKDLHAALKHLTWQTQQVANGDYQQRVDFMGDFTEAFNAMVEQLELQRSALLKEIESRRIENEVLLQNKSLYELLIGQIMQWIIVVDADTAEWMFVSREIECIFANPACEQKLRQWISMQTETMEGECDVCTADIDLPCKGSIKYYSVSIHPMHWHQRNAITFVLTDVSRERVRLNKLQSIANYDTLTQIYNRHYGMEVLNEWLSEVKTLFYALLILIT